MVRAVEVDEEKLELILGLAEGVAVGALAEIGRGGVAARVAEVSAESRRGGDGVVHLAPDGVGEGARAAGEGRGQDGAQDAAEDAKAEADDAEDEAEARADDGDWEREDRIRALAT